MLRKHKAYSFHLRNGVYYVQFWNQATKKYTGRKSTGATNREDAGDVVAGWLLNGIPTGTARKRIPDVLSLDTIQSAIRSKSFNDADAQAVLLALKERGFIESAFTKASPSAELLPVFLRRVWKADGPYVSERRAYRHTISQRHIQTAESAIRVHWEPAFRAMRLGDVRRNDLKAFAVSLSMKGLAPKTVNKILSFGTTVLRWASQNDLIPDDPTRGVYRFADIQVKKRGILSSGEVEALCMLPASEWCVKAQQGRYSPPVEREKAAFIIALTAGLRLGEVAALRACDIGVDRLYVRHSWSDVDRLKTPKNGDERLGILIPIVRRIILSLLENNPFPANGEQFVFWGRYADRPVDPMRLSRGFNKALAAIGICDSERRKRGLSFQSLRHGFAKEMADRVAIEQAMQATGHKSRAMLEHYADHHTQENYVAVMNASTDAFNKVLRLLECDTVG
jgi:integrase